MGAARELTGLVSERFAGFSTLSIQMAACVLGIDDSAVVEFIGSGKLPANDCREPGQRHAWWLIDRRDLEKFMDSESKDNPMSVKSMKLSTRTTTCLVMKGIHTVDRLVRCSPSELLKLQNFGRLSLIEIRQALSLIGLSLSNDMIAAQDPECCGVEPEELVSDLPKFIARAKQNVRRVGSPGSPLFRVSRRLRGNMCGVYVIRCETTGRYKIGKSVDVAMRLHQHSYSLACDEVPGPLRLLRMIPCTPEQLGLTELFMHRLYGESRIGSAEFFEAELDPAPETLRSVKDVLEACQLRLASTLEG